MELYNPPSVALPALKITKTRERQAMEDDTTINSLIRSNLLLDVEFNALYLDIFKKSKELLRIIRLSEDELFLESPYWSRVLESTKKFESRKFTFMRYFLLKKREDISKTKRKEFDEAIFEIRRELYTELRKTVVRFSNKIQNRISAFEEKRKVELSILSSTTIHVCKNCAKIISLDKFKRCACVCGEKITKISQVKQIPIHHFNDRLINFLERNYWFEHGVDYLLRRKNLQTLVGFHVLGHSGVRHEIDNIADSKSENYRFFCECKNAEVAVKDIFVFSGKMIDVGCTRGYVFTTSVKASDEIVRLARSKNIDIVRGALTRETKNLLKDIKEG
jgi:hypothetical protein